MCKFFLIVVPLLALAFPGDAIDVHQGNVMNVTDNSITIQDADGALETFTVAKDCKITHGGKPESLKDIDNGDVASVTVAQVDGKLVATEIDARCRG